MNGSATYIGGLSADTGAGPSRNLWQDCPWDQILNDPGVGYGFFDDFLDTPLIGTQTTEIASGRYKVFNTGAGTVVPVTNFNSVERPGGVLSIAVDTNNDSGSVAQSYPSFLMSGVKSTGGKLWFEARIACTPITTNGVGWFVGLAETELWTLATGVPFNGGDAITNTASAIGFRKEEDGLGVVDTVYTDRATSFTNVGDAAGSVTNYGWTKLGIVYDPENAAECVKFYFDGIPHATVISQATLTALTNLDANNLGLLAAVVADSSGTSGVLYMDWWRVAQLR